MRSLETARRVSRDSYRKRNIDVFLDEVLQAGSYRFLTCVLTSYSSCAFTSERPDVCTCRPDVVLLLPYASSCLLRCFCFNHLRSASIMQNGPSVNHDERTPLLSATYGNNEGVHQSLSARRRSLNAIAAGSQSEFGGVNQGLESFRQIVARNRLLSNAEQDEAVIDLLSRAALSSLQSALTTLQAYEKLVYLLHGYVPCSPYWQDVIATVQASPQIIIGFCRYSIVGSNLISLGRLGTSEPIDP